MKLRTLGLSGFDNTEEYQFRQVFNNAGVPGWSLAAEADADALIIDFDSMYGQMSWLRAQTGERPIVALTAGNRADASHVLRRPVSEFALIELLARLEEHIAETVRAGEQNELSGSPEAAIVDPGKAAAVTLPADGVEPETTLEPEPQPAPDRCLLDYLQPGNLPDPALLDVFDSPLVVDLAGDAYYGSASLKSLVDHASRPIDDDQWQALDADQLAQWQTRLPKQPLARLRWLAGLSAGSGSLLADLRDATRFKLNKWPQAEREYPKLFRVATALLKQFSTVDELANTSGVSADEVRDFINACHAIGLIDVEKPAPQPAQAAEGASRGGLLGRLRGKG